MDTTQMNINLLDIEVKPKEELQSPFESDNLEYTLTYPFNYVYINTDTKTYIEFYLDGVEEGMSTDAAIEHFLQRVDRFDKDPQALSKNFLKQIQEKDQDLLMLAPYSKKVRDALSKMIFIQKENEHYIDAYGFTYKIEMRGKEYAYLSYTPPGGEMILFYVEKDAIEQSGNVLRNVGVNEEF